MNNKTTNLEKLKSVDSKVISGWADKAEWRKVNESWLDESFRIGMEVLEALRAQGISQKDLADKLGVSAQQVNKIVKGTENLTLETKHNLQRALGIKLGCNRTYRYDLDKAKPVSNFSYLIKKGLQAYKAPQQNYNRINKYDQSGLLAACA